MFEILWEIMLIMLSHEIFTLAFRMNSDLIPGMSLCMKVTDLGHFQ